MVLQWIREFVRRCYLVFNLLNIQVKIKKDDIEQEKLDVTKEMESLKEMVEQLRNEIVNVKQKVRAFDYTKFRICKVIICRETLRNRE